jgi:hypothetical protein
VAAKNRWRGGWAAALAVSLVTAVVALVLVSSATPAGRSLHERHPLWKEGRFWEWGWGLYNEQVPVDAQAVFDWSTVSFGNVAVEQVTLDRINTILEINPDHKFVIRVWPLIGLGVSPPGTLFEYLYEPGVAEAMHAEVWSQIRFVLDGITKPENVVGLTFLEELPLHFTSEAALGWYRGLPMPWDIATYEAQINADLGEPFDMGREDHRMWWGEMYSAVLAELHSTMKEAGEGREVFIWHQTPFRTLDMLAPGESMFQADVIPIYYSDIIQPGLVDGIFGYPNTEAIWQQKTLDIADGFEIPFWSQLSVPGYMRIMSWEDTMELATYEHPGNLGTMIYAEASTEPGVWNRMPYMDGVTHWTMEDHVRQVAQILGLQP